MNTISPTISPEDLAVDMAEPSSDDVLVRVENVSKKFCRGLKKSLWYGLKDVAHELNPFASRHANDTMFLRPDEFLAVDDVSFELRRGECLGLIGHNGAGKTTLLKMLNGLIKPDSGRIEMRGRIGALIALGAGFNPILTGRENIYVNGSVLGLTKKEIDERIEEIIDFAEIREFIDAPVQSYSSGMSVRLGFAVATALQPDILILDEVLAVGDVGFRFKSANRLRSIMKDTAVILVSHQMASISSICDRGLVLQLGKVTQNGSVDDAIRVYNESNQVTAGREGNLEVHLHESLIDAYVSHPSEIGRDDLLEVEIQIDAREERENCFVRLVFCTEMGTAVAEFNSRQLNQFFRLRKGVNLWKVDLPRLCLNAGCYLVDFFVHDLQTKTILFRSYCNNTVKIGGEDIVYAPCVIR